MRNRSSVLVVPGAPGAAEVLSTALSAEKSTLGKPRMVKTENYQSSTWKPYSRECNEEGVVKEYVSTGRTFTTVTLQDAAPARKRSLG
jgi:hypothetical protein